MSPRSVQLSLGFLAATALSACASGGGQPVNPPPAWFLAHEKNAVDAYPNIADAPQPSPQTRTEAQYRELERSLWNQRAVIKSSPRGEPPPPPGAASEAAAEFENEVRSTIATMRPPSETAAPTPGVLPPNSPTLTPLPPPSPRQ